jgi:fused signal recognition particle receptor
MELFPRLIAMVADILGMFGVAPDYRPAIALVLLYLLATAVVLGLVFALWKVTRRPPEPPRPPKEFREAKPPPPPAPTAPPKEKLPPEAEKAPPAEEVPPPPVPPVPVAEPLPVVPVVSLFERMRAGLRKTQTGLVGRIDALLGSRAKVDEELLEELEEILITADFGMRTTQDLIQALSKRLARQGSMTPEQLRTALREEIRLRLHLEAAPLEPGSVSPYVIMVVGVNGVGKTTTIGKIAHQFVQQGKKVVLGAGDTFRAAAVEQLTIWGERTGAPVIRHGEGADPAAVAFDAVKAAIARGADVLLLDTAGRLHTKVNLMEELKKVRRVLDRELPGAPHETLLVLDASTGQNALTQARLFREAVQVSGLALTKLDGTAKGGMVVAIGTELGLPVRYIGIGEGVEDLRPFDPDLFVDALFAENSRS